MKSRSFTILAIVAVLAMLAYAVDASAAMHTLTFDPSMLVLAGAPAAIEIKDLVAAIDKLEASAGKDVGEIKEKVGELQARLQEAEQKLDKRGRDGGSSDGGDGLSIAKIVGEHDGFKMLKKGTIKSTQMVIPADALHSKAAMTSTTGAALVNADRQPGIVLPAQRRLAVRDLLPALRTDAGSIEYVRESASSNGAATVAEGALKPESTVTMELVNANVVTIATWMSASKQILDDVSQLQNYLDNRLRFMVRYREELQLLLGSGTGNNLLGLYTGATAYASPVTYATPTKIDVIRLALGQLEDANYFANGVVLHPDDWTLIELLKDTDGKYLKSNPEDAGVRRLWGKPVVTTTAMSVGTFLTGDFPAAATLYDRQDPTLDIATQDQDDFVRNLVKLRVEERVSLALQLPGALVKGSFPA